VCGSVPPLPRIFLWLGEGKLQLYSLEDHSSYIISRGVGEVLTVRAMWCGGIGGGG